MLGESGPSRGTADAPEFSFGDDAGHRSTSAATGLREKKDEKDEKSSHVSYPLVWSDLI
jgi:hypothetical protein